MNFSLLRKERFIRLNKNIYKGKFLQGLESSSYEIELHAEVFMITLVNSCKMLSELAFDDDMSDGPRVFQRLGPLRHGLVSLIE